MWCRFLILYLVVWPIQHNSFLCFFLINFDLGPKAKKQKFQRRQSRQYRYKVKCAACKKEMNCDHFVKHNLAQHQGKATFSNVLDSNQTTINFSQVLHVLFHLLFYVILIDINYIVQNILIPTYSWNSTQKTKKSLNKNYVVDVSC